MFFSSANQNLEQELKFGHDRFFLPNQWETNIYSTNILTYPHIIVPYVHYRFHKSVSNSIPEPDHSITLPSYLCKFRFNII
jgi:hypothetical protein